MFNMTFHQGENVGEWSDSKIQIRFPTLLDALLYIVFTGMAFHLCEFRGAWSDSPTG